MFYNGSMRRNKIHSIKIIGRNANFPIISPKANSTLNNEYFLARVVSRGELLTYVFIFAKNCFNVFQQKQIILIVPIAGFFKTNQILVLNYFSFRIFDFIYSSGVGYIFLGPKSIPFVF